MLYKKLNWPAVVFSVAEGQYSIDYLGDPSYTKGVRANELEPFTQDALRAWSGPKNMKDEMRQEIRAQAEEYIRNKGARRNG